MGTDTPATHSHCPTCNTTARWRWDVTHCPTCKTRLIDVTPVGLVPDADVEEVTIDDLFTPAERYAYDAEDEADERDHVRHEEGR